MLKPSAVAFCLLLAALVVSGSPASALALATHKGEWTQARLLITPERLGAVKVGMTLKQARKASGLKLRAVGDGEYSSPKAPNLEWQRGFGKSCVKAFRPAAVHTAAGVTFGDTLKQLRKAYGKRLHFHTGPTGYSDPTSYFVRDKSKDILFFHLTHGRHGKVYKMASGHTLRAAYC